MLRDAIATVLREMLPLQVFPATVLKVNRAEACFDAQPLDKAAPELFDVRLRAVDDDTATGFISWPAEQSVVLIGLINNDINTAFMVAASDVETFTLSTAEESLLTWLQDFVQVMVQQKFPTPAGLSGPSDHLPQLQQLLQRLPRLLSA
jgi:hypothetical protein